MDSTFRPVKQRHKKVIIVASGNSLRGFDLSRLEKLQGIVTIAINSAVNYFQPDYFITIDPGLGTERSFLNLNIPKSCYTFVGYKECISGVHNLKRKLIKTADAVSIGNGKLCEKEHCIQTHNSAFAAINLAYHFKAEKLLLLGVDANQDCHFYDDNSTQYKMNPKGWKLSISKLPKLCEIAKPQLDNKNIQVINGSINSNIQCFPKVSIEEALLWITK